jgi:hypothetical protein
VDINRIANTRDLSYLLAPAIQKLEMIQRRIEEAKRAVRAERARLREITENGHFAEAEVRGREISIFDLTRREVHHRCRVCHAIKKSRDMKLTDLCEACYYNIEEVCQFLGGETPEILKSEQKAQGAPSGGVVKAPLHGAGDFGSMSPTQDEPDNNATLNIGR